jgi:hypothetical protein
MAKINKERLTADVEGDFVVFLIGMRINRLWKMHKWLPVVTAMPKMLAELAKDPDSGFLGATQALISPRMPVVIQYWRSFEQLERYARSKDTVHYPAWVKFNRRVGSSGDVGIWHETYAVRAGEYECVYNNMPAFGLAKVTKLVPAAGYRTSAAGRMGRDEQGEGAPAGA